MNAIQLLRQMHADTKVRFKLILGCDDPKRAAQQWSALQSLLELHEQLEDDFVYTPLFKDMGPGTPLGDWFLQHESEVVKVQQLIQASARLDSSTPEWRMAIGAIMDALNKHVTDEEGQIFGRIEQVWDQPRLEQAGQQMQKLKDSVAPGRKPRAAPAKSANRRGAPAIPPTRRTRQEAPRNG